LTRDRTVEEEPDQPARGPTAPRPVRPTHARPSGGGGAEELDERTSPFPYAENFDEWAADETAAPDDRNGGSHP
jgi:hypothetical protein